jgi:hypothetical protein
MKGGGRGGGGTTAFWDRTTPQAASDFKILLHAQRHRGNGGAAGEGGRAIRGGR